MKQPTPSELDAHIVAAGYGGELVATTVVCVRDVLQPEFFGDWVCVRDVRKPGAPWYMAKCRTLPTPNELTKRKRNANGTAIIRAGVLYRRAMEKGYHNPKTYGTQRPAMRQVANIDVHRDDDGDKVIDWTRWSKVWKDAKGINIHDYRGSSAGCITQPEQEDVDDLLEVIAAHGADRWDLLVIEPLSES